jgi:hypothetical protein
MPANKRPRRERTDDWQKIQQYTLWPEQKVYELLRPVVLFNESATERAKETGAAERSVRRNAAQFEAHGMASLFEHAPKEDAEDPSRSLPPDMRQLIVDLRAEVSSQYFGVNLLLSFRRGASVLDSPMDDPQIFEMILSLVYMNTLMIQQVYKDGNWQKRFTKEDYRGVTPLFYSHVEPYGMLQLDMTKRLALA